MPPLLSIVLGVFSSIGSLTASLHNATPDLPLHFYFENRRESLDVSLLDRDHGGVQPAALAELSHFVRCFRTERERPIHPRLAEIVARTAQAFGKQQIDVISGYRAAPYGAPHSKHFLGHAMDLKIVGVAPKKLAAWVWHNFRGVGVGWYPNQQFVHVDVRDTDVSWIDNAHHGESGSVRYFARPRIDKLPANAPHLDYDRAKEVAPAAIASTWTIDASKDPGRSDLIGVRAGN